jgi:diacylglycerol O-acyltransferase
VEGLLGGQWALVFKVHHSIVDGVGGMQTLLDLLDPGDSLPLPPAAPRPTSSPDRSRAYRLGRTARHAVDFARATVALPVAAGRFVTGIPAGLHALRFAPSSSLNGELGRARTFRTLTVDRAEIDVVRDRFGGTVNDVVLAMVSNGFHDLLKQRGEKPVPGAVRCMVPVNVRTATEAAVGANKVSFVLVDLPVELSDPRDVYVALRSRIGKVKRSSAKNVLKTGFALADQVPAPIASAFIAAVRQVPQRIVTTICTNVPGPRTPQTLFGRPLVALYPYVPIGDRVRIAVAVTSHDGRMHFGVTCDRRSVQDADVFVEAMATGLRDLAKLAGADIIRS